MRVTLAALLCLSICTVSTAADRRPGAIGEPTPPAPIWGAEIHPVAWADVLDGLHLEFFDPESDRRFTATGPFEVIDEAPNRVEVRASTLDGEDAPTLTILQTVDGLWALARFADYEFATRIE